MAQRETTHMRVRIESRLLQRLEKASEKAGRPLTGEITRRLEETFQKEGQADLVEILLGGGENVQVLRMIATAMQLQRDGTRNWKDDRLSAETVRIAVDQIIAGVAGLPRDPPQRATPERDHKQWDLEAEMHKAGKKVPALAGRDTAAILLNTAGYKSPE
jgi:hypothetical protein